MEKKRIALLGKDCPLTRIIYHVLKREFGDVQVVLEEPVSRIQILRRRIATLGLVTVVGQILFMVFVPLLRRACASRIEAIKRECDLKDSPIDDEEVIRVDSVNSEKARQVLRQLESRVVVVNGARIIAKETLACVTAPFVNAHAGITPLYRGVHGGYWALVEGRADLVGTTVHFIDEGIDTGPVIGQALFSVASADSFATYPYLHINAGLPILVSAVRRIINGSLQTGTPVADLPSRLRSHPTFWGYLYAWLSMGVR